MWVWDWGWFVCVGGLLVWVEGWFIWVGGWFVWVGGWFIWVGGWFVWIGGWFVCVVGWFVCVEGLFVWGVFLRFDDMNFYKVLNCVCFFILNFILGVSVNVDFYIKKLCVWVVCIWGDCRV